MPRTNKNQEFRRNPDGSTTLVREETVVISDDQLAPDEADNVLRSHLDKARKVVTGRDNAPFNPLEITKILAAMIVKQGGGV